MRFSWSTHLLMCLFLETLTSIVRTGFPILVELMDLVNTIVIFISQMTLLRCLGFIHGSLTLTLTILLFLISSFLLMLVFVLQWLSLYAKTLIMFSQFPLTFCQTQKWDARFIIKLLTIVTLIGMVFVIICDMLHTIFLNSVLLLLLVNFVCGFRYQCPLLQISGQASLILIVFSCLCCCHSS